MFRRSREKKYQRNAANAHNFYSSLKIREKSDRNNDSINRTQLDCNAHNSLSSLLIIYSAFNFIVALNKGHSIHNNGKMDREKGREGERKR